MKYKLYLNILYIHTYIYICIYFCSCESGAAVKSEDIDGRKWYDNFSINLTISIKIYHNEIP